MSDGCAAPEQTAELPAGIDLAKEIVLGGKVTAERRVHRGGRVLKGR
jgi:hypothetical protein